MIFDGKVGDKRKVSLRGAREQKTSRDIIQEAQKARELREIERKRNQACCLLQAKVRQFLSKRQSQQQFRQIFDKKCHDIEQIKRVFFTQGKHFHIPIDIFNALLQSCLFFFHVTEDMTRLLKLEEMLVDLQGKLWTSWQCTSMSNGRDMQLFRLQKLLKFIFQRIIQLCMKMKGNSLIEMEIQKHSLFLQQFFALSTQDISTSVKRTTAGETQEEMAHILLMTFSIESLTQTCHQLAQQMDHISQTISLTLWSRWLEVMEALLQRALLVRDLLVEHPHLEDGEEGKEQDGKHTQGEESKEMEQQRQYEVRPQF